MKEFSGTERANDPNLLLNGLDVTKKGDVIGYYADRAQERRE